LTTKIIDLFSGPGGLGEGFTSLLDENKNTCFKIAVSIEKDPSAHRTLKLRAFFRQFSNGLAPDEYYEFMKGKLGDDPEEQLYKLFPDEATIAAQEAVCLELGKDNKAITQLITSNLGDDECVLIGGPPCQAYSTAGVARNKSNKDYDATKDQRNFLYKEYLGVIAKFQPKIFVMENVKGMLSAKVNGRLIYKDIFDDLMRPTKASGIRPQKGRKAHGYRIFSLVQGKENLQAKDYIIHSENFGIPQKRHRVILLGIRDDLGVGETIPTLQPAETRMSVRQVLYDLPKLRSGLSKSENTDENWLNTIHFETQRPIKQLYKTHPEVATSMSRTVDSMRVPKSKQGAVFGLKRSNSNNALGDWYYDPRLGNYITNHQTRGHLDSDLARYLFCSAWAYTHQATTDFASPKTHDFPEALVPAHKNFKSGKFADRFRVQTANQPATTITCHISKDGHYYIHPDTAQCRSLTVREAARIQRFPDNYRFVGNRTQQYVQVGNAVPPLLANQIAAVVVNLLNNTL